MRTRRIVAPTEVAVTLRDLHLVDRDTERLIFRSQASEDGAVLIGDNDFDEVLGYLAAEANHESNDAVNAAWTLPSRSSRALSIRTPTPEPTREER